jgi:hypothetical protein
MKAIHWLLLLFVLTGGCTQKYNAPYHFPGSGYLVVEGYINTDTLPTNIMLSRATGLDSPYYLAVDGATVNVESAAGTSFNIPDVGGGTYSGGPLPLDETQQYRVRIATSDGQQFLSDLVPVKITPPIDSASWKTTDGGVTIYVSSHDPENNTHYYQWKYDETWEYHSAFASNYEYSGGMVIPRPQSDLIYTCWQTDTSTDIIIGSSAKLSSDVIYEFPVAIVPFINAKKLSVRYSILIRQYALTEDWYNFDQMIQKNTEQLGSIFDPQPSSLSGNIHCLTNPNEPVVGFIGCTSETDARIFIDRSQLSPAQVITSGYEGCLIDTIFNVPAFIVDTFGSGSYIPIEPTYKQGLLYGWLAGTASCVNCTLHGGFLQKPDYWQ